MNYRLIFEILTEEIPVKEQFRFKKEAPVLAEKLLKEARLEYESLKVETTPRRLILTVEKLSENQTEYTEEVAGPPKVISFKDGEPTKAVLGFLKKNKKELSDIYTIQKGGKDYVAVKVTETASPAVSVLPEVLKNFVNGINWSKSMRWGDNDYTFSRPVLGFCAKFGTETIVFSSHGKTSSNILKGHRFSYPEPFVLENADNYESELEKRNVIVDFEKRKSLISEQLNQIAEEHSVKLIEDPELLNEVSVLVEYPYTIMGTFKKEFLAVPPEVILSAMRKHQRYFAFEGKNGLEPKFATVLGTELKDPSVAAGGNERVLSARLSDAVFFWDEDRKKTLESRRSKMEKMIYHRKLGTLWDKIERLISISVFFANKLNIDTDTVKRAALLCKMDLETQMVYEFPELQGIMGSAYAKEEGEPEEIYIAVREHYKPAFSGDSLPSTKTGTALALADKADTIIAGIAAGLKPTGSADPFALRRASLGFLRIILENEIDISFEEIISYVAKLLSITVDVAECKNFMIDRLRTLFKQETSGEIVEAVLAVENDNPLTALKKLRAVNEISDTEEFNALVKLFKRMNILKKAEKFDDRVETDLLVHDSEKRLYKELISIENQTSEMLQNHDYVSALKTMIPLWKAVDEFFDDAKGVRVMDDNPEIRRNRLALLFKLDTLFKQTADFKMLSGLK